MMIMGGIWLVVGLNWVSVVEVLWIDGWLVFGGILLDVLVVVVIQDLKVCGFEVMFYLFILMDILLGNVLLDFYGRVE